MTLCRSAPFAPFVTRFGVNEDLMDYSLTDEEIRLLKELKAACHRGRTIAQAPLVLARLIRAGYVKRRVIKASPVRYVITDLGEIALVNASA
jgi:hypothetical protein